MIFSAIAIFLPNPTLGHLGFFLESSSLSKLEFLNLCMKHFTILYPVYYLAVTDVKHVLQFMEPLNPLRFPDLGERLNNIEVRLW